MSRWEWVAAAVATLVVVATVALLLREALSGRATPPDLTLRVDSVVEVGSGYLVELRAENRGSTTAAGVVVEAELSDERGEVETSQVTLDYVPAEASRSAGVYFTHDPRRYRLSLRPLGYARP